MAMTVLAAMPPLLAQTAPAPVPGPTGTLDRIRQAGRIRLGYRTDARPFAYRDESGQAAGYSIDLCQTVVEAVKGAVGSALAVEWVPVTVDTRLSAVRTGDIDVLCGSETVTLARRKEVAFSIPIFPGGVGVLVRSDAPSRLQDVLAGRGPTFHPVWRASASQVLQARAFSAVTGTTAGAWLPDRIRDLQVVTTVTPVDSYDAGVQGLLDRRSDAFFGERAILLDAARRHPSSGDLTVLDRLFTYEPLAFAVGRGDEDFRLLVDQALAQLYHSGRIRGVYTKWFGEPDQSAITFFRWNALSD
jgi:ABC-type amino acid transport substrate-binding protein